MKGTWDQRYDVPEYLFGTQPADFLVRAAGYIPPRARVLCVADGEGRNSVWLAGQGHRVTAFDGSRVAVAKARNLAESKGVHVDLNVAAAEDWSWADGAFDAVVGIFIQFAPPAARSEMFAGMARALRPGGVVLLHGYTPDQLRYGTGGPSQLDQLYTADALTDAFPGWEVLRLEAYEAELAEGIRHRGTSALIDFVARKPG